MFFSVLFFTCYYTFLIDQFSVTPFQTKTPHHLSAYILTHLFCPICVFGDCLNGAAGNDAQLTEVQKMAFSDLFIASLDHFDYFE
jgi:hypothetical protein